MDRLVGWQLVHLLFRRQRGRLHGLERVCLHQDVVWLSVGELAPVRSNRVVGTRILISHRAASTIHLLLLGVRYVVGA